MLFSGLRCIRDNNTFRTASHTVRARHQLSQDHPCSPVPTRLTKLGTSSGYNTFVSSSGPGAPPIRLIAYCRGSSPRTFAFRPKNKVTEVLFFLKYSFQHLNVIGCIIFSKQYKCSTWFNLVTNSSRFKISFSLFTLNKIFNLASTFQKL